MLCFSFLFSCCFFPHRIGSITNHFYREKVVTVLLWQIREQKKLEPWLSCDYEELTLSNGQFMPVAKLQRHIPYSVDSKKRTEALWCAPQSISSRNNVRRLKQKKLPPNNWKLFLNDKRHCHFHFTGQLLLCYWAVALVMFIRYAGFRHSTVDSDVTNGLLRQKVIPSSVILWFCLPNFRWFLTYLATMSWCWESLRLKRS